MVALLISLKLRLLRGSLRGSLSQRIGLAFGALAGLAMALGGVASLVALRIVDAEIASTVVVSGGTLLVVGWGVVPLLVSGVDETLDPARFALLPVPARRLVPGLIAAGLVGVPGIATALVAAATVVTWSRGPAPVLLAVPGAVLGVLTCVLTSRLITTAAARLLSTRRFREVGAAIAVLLLTSVGLWPSLLAQGRIEWEMARSALSTLGWTPMGLAWAAPADAATGHLWRGLLRLALAVGVVVLGALSWAPLLDRALADTATSGGTTRARVGTSVLDRFPDGPAWAIAARSLRYWRRDPRYLVAMSAVVASSIVPVVASRSSGTGTIAIGLGPFLGVMLGITTSNDVGYDGSAFAAHLLVGVRGRTDRLGRAAATTVIGTPIVIVAAVAGAMLAGYPHLWPAAVGAGVAGLLGGVGASALASALVAYPVPEAGSNPFRGTSGGGARAALAQGGVLSVAVGLAMPSIAFLILAIEWWPAGNWIALVVGILIGPAALWAGIEAGGTVMDNRGPELLASVRKAT